MSATTTVRMQTSMGQITIELDNENAPISSENFLAYVRDVLANERDLIDEEYNDRIHLWLATYTTPHLDAHGGAADAFHCAYGYFYSGIPCGAVDGLIDWAAGMPDLDRADVYTRIENRLFGPAGTYPAVPLWADTLYLGAADTLSGVGAYGPAWWGDWTAG